MNTHEELELKKEFQLERIILFSDAVFAIILTIMVIELKLPETARHASPEEFRHEFIRVAFHFLGYAISFFFVAMFWTRHVKLIGFLKDYNRTFLILNLLFLFCVSLFPFAVSMITGFSSLATVQAQWGFNVYVVVILISLLTFNILTNYLIKNKEALCYGANQIENALRLKVVRSTFIIVPLIILLLALFNYLNIAPQYFVYVMLVYGIVVSRVSRHYYPKSKTDKNGKPILVRMFERRKKQIAKVKQMEQE